MSERYVTTSLTGFRIKPGDSSSRGSRNAPTCWMVYGTQAPRGGGVVEMFDYHEKGGKHSAVRERMARVRCAELNAL